VVISSLSLAGYLALILIWHPHHLMKFDLLGWLLCALFVMGSMGLAAGKSWARWMSLGLTIFFICIICLASIGVLFFSAFAAPAKDLVYILLVGFLLSITLLLLLFLEAVNMRSTRVN
jgi:hypothetical protein